VKKIVNKRSPQAKIRGENGFNFLGIISESQKSRRIASRKIYFPTGGAAEHRSFGWATKKEMPRMFSTPVAIIVFALTIFDLSMFS